MAHRSPTTAVDALTIAGAIRAAIRTGVLDVIEHAGPIGTEALAARTHLDPTGVALLVDALAAVGVVTPVDGDPDEGDRVALAGSAAGWVALEAITAPVVALVEGREVCDRPLGPAYASAVEVLGLLAGAVLNPWVGPRARPGLRLLEVGAGDAPWTRALAAVAPEMRATLVDHPDVLGATERRLAEQLPTTAVEARAGDAHRIDLGGPYDLIVVSGFCRLFDAATNQRLFARLADALDPHGELLVLDAVVLEDPSELAVYRLSLASRRSRGRTHSLDDYTSWMSAAGLATPAVCRSDHPALTLLSTRTASGAQP